MSSLLQSPSEGEDDNAKETVISSFILTSLIGVDLGIYRYAAMGGQVCVSHLLVVHCASYPVMTTLYGSPQKGIWALGTEGMIGRISTARISTFVSINDNAHHHPIQGGRLERRAHDS